MAVFKMDKRINWIDYTKTLCIFLVVLGHSHLPDYVKNMIYVFHIPLFFFISGMLFTFDKYPSYPSFLKKRTAQLIIPYLFFNVVTYLFWVFIGRKVGNDIQLGLHPTKQLIGIFIGNDAYHYLEHCSPLWFLTCLFSVENLYYLFFRYVKVNYKIFVIALFASAGYLDYIYNPIRFPWGLNVALTMVVFYAFGSYLRTIILSSKNKSIAWWLVLSAISYAGIFLISKLNGKVEVSVGDYQNYFYFIVGALFGISFVISICKVISLSFGDIQFIQFIGRNTIVILGFHLLAGSFIKAISFYLLKLPFSIYEITQVSVIYSILSILFLIPVMLFINKYIPFTIGKTKQ